MRDYEYEEVIEYIEDYINNFNEVPSLREIAKIFKTSHSQIKRVLKKLNKWLWYLEIRENLLNKEQEESNEDDLINYLVNISKDKPKLEVNYNIDNRYIDYNNNFNKIIIKKVGFITDIHLGHHNDDAISIAVSFLKDVGIDTLVVGGDVIDNESVSFWKNKGSLSLVEEIELTKKFIKNIRNIFNSEKIFWLESNHFERLEKYIISKADKLIPIEEIKLENLLKFKEYGIEFISNKKLIKETGKPFNILGLYYLHGHEVKLNWSGVNIARSMFMKVLDNVIFGHFHRTQEYIQKTISNEYKGAWSVGCLCDLSPDYHYINNWNLGFAYIEYYDDGTFRVYNKKIINDVIY